MHGVALTFMLILQVRSSLSEKMLSVPGLPQGLLDICMCGTPEFPAIVLAVASQPRGGGSGVTVFAFTAACLRSGDAAHVRRCGWRPCPTALRVKVD